MPTSEFREEITLDILVCRIAWMETYASEQEPAFSNQRYIKKGGNIPYESLNFLPDADGNYYGYAPVGNDAAGKPGKISIGKFGAKPNENNVTDITVIFAAENTEKKFVVVGFYLSSTIFREPIERPDRVKQKIGSIIRFESRNAKLIPLDDRHFRIPRGKNGMGQANIWYGLTPEKNPELYKDFINYIKGEDVESLPTQEESASEKKRIAAHRRVERSGSIRHFIHIKGYCCEACGWSIEKQDYNIWGSSFELHHLKPFSELALEEERHVKEVDLAVLCASCHRAVHRTDFTSNIKAFKEMHICKPRER